MTIKSEDFQLCESITEEEAKLLNEKDTSSNLKFDGVRVIAVVQNGQTALVGRRGIYPFQFKEVTEDMGKMPNGIYDGEIISHCDTFNKIQRRAGTRDRRKQEELRKEIPAKYMVFDILNLKGQSLTSKPLRERIEILKKVFEEFDKEVTNKKPSGGLITIEMAEYKPINEMLKKAHEEDREGIIVKNLNSPYEHKRSKGWLKCKFFLETTIKICRYTENPKGIRVEDKFGNACQVAGEQSIEVKHLLDTQKEVEINIQYLEKTVEGRFRFPSYRGLVK